MKKILALCWIICLSLTCLSRTATRLEEKPLKTFESNFSNFTVKINNRKDSRIYIDLYIQDVESFEKNNTQFLPIYYFSESFKSDKIDFAVPNGKYIGFLSITLLDNAFFNRTITGYHTVYFGINKDHKKANYSGDKCSQLKKYDYDFDRITKNTHCSEIEITKKETILEFSISENDEINSLRTLLLLWPSFSYAALQGPQQYPYAVFLIMQGFFGFTARDTLINFDNFDSF
ncbi:hypothetical protein [Leptospira brenneri]|uniref:hypothetical protein n=1 Tax=Leptospira brenneri TaxID=2023182 RepID=UPI000C2A5268|nr:hypothetical protein [Leptospira brenneri]PJZ43756.1 hypothetical protein CH361_18560 [Leptospira brenneri]